MRRTLCYRYNRKPIHQLQRHCRKWKTIRLYGEWDGTLTRRLLNKKGVSNALLNQLEILGLVQPVRVGGVVEYRIGELRNSWLQLQARGIWIEWRLHKPESPYYWP